MGGERRKTRKASGGTEYEPVRLDTQTLTQYAGGGFLVIIERELERRRCFCISTIAVHRMQLCVTYAWVFVGDTAISWRPDEKLMESKKFQYNENLTRIRSIDKRSERIMVQLYDGSKEMIFFPKDDSPILPAIIENKLKFLAGSK